MDELNFKRVSRQKVRIKPIKNLQISNGMPERIEKTEKQLLSHKVAGIKQMIGYNPMRNPESAKKSGSKRKGRITSPNTLFKKGNNFGSKREMKNKTKSGWMMGVRNIGRKPSELAIAKSKIRMLINNPMKNSLIVEKQVNSRKNKKH